MLPVFSRKSFVFLLLGVFVLLFGVAQSVSAVQCVASDPAIPGTPVWNRGGTCDYPITYRDSAGGSNLIECQFQALNWNEDLAPAGWGSAVANPDNCTGDEALMKSGDIVIGSTGDCTLNGQDTCWLYWKATDNSGNSDFGLLKSFDIDYVGPTLTQVTAVPSPTNDTTPNYTFNSTEAGTITYGGDCSSTTTSAVAGDNTVTFSTLSQGTHSNCTITVTDATGNPSSPLSVDSFTITIDTTAPTVANVSSDKANGSYTVGEVIDIDVTFSEAVTSTDNVTVTLETGTIDRTCAFTVLDAITSTCDYTVQVGDTSADLTVASISGTIKDAALNAMTNFVPTTNLAVSKAIVIDTIAPAITSFTINTIGCSGNPCTAETITTKNALDIAWTTNNDDGGSGIQKHEVWRAPDNSGSPGSWACIIGIGCPDNRNANPAGETDNPPEGTYWYGVHAIDNATNCISEDTTGADKGHACGGAGSDSLDTRLDKGPMKVVMDRTAPDTAIVSNPSSSSRFTSANFSFISTELGSTFQCKIDTEAFSSCISPKRYSGIIEASHTFEVKATDVAGNTDLTPASYTWVVDTTPPGEPGTPDITATSDTGFSSTDNITNNTLPTWVWDASTGNPSSYEMQWATNSGFTQSFSSWNVDTNFYTHVQFTKLSENTWYFRVKAKDAAGNESGFSDTGTVVIDITAPGAPNLISPSGTISTTTPTFNWNTVNDPNGVTYTLWVDNNSNFGSLEINQSGLASSSYTPGGGILVDGTTYYWKVRAVDGAGNMGNFPAQHNTFTVVLNQTPTSPTSPLQFKNDGSTSISNQGFTNETIVKLRASATDADTPEVIRLFFEVALNSGSFASPATPTIGTSCASGTSWSSCSSKIWYVSSSNGNHSSTPFTGTTGIAELSTATGYKWQVKACDDSSACSGWVAFNITRPNFSVDIAAPIVSFFAITPDSSVSPNWTRTNVLISWNDPGAGTGITDSGGLGLKQIEVWRAWDATGNGVQPNEWNDNSPLPGTQPNPIYTKTSGFTSSISDDGSYTDITLTESGTYWYGLHVVDNAGNIGYEPSSKKALVDKDEPTTEIDAPADSWLRRSAQQQSFLKTFEEDLQSGLDSDGCTLEVCSYEPNGTEHCKGTESRACNITTNTEEIFVGPSAAHCDYQGWGACVISIGAADLAGNTAEFSKEYNVDWEFPRFPGSLNDGLGKLYVTAAEEAQTYPMHVQEDVPTTYRVHVTDNIGVSYCNLYIDGILEQGPVIPSGCTIDCTVEFEGVVLPDPGGDHTYSNNYAVCYDVSTLGSQSAAENIVVETLTVSLSAVPTSGSVDTRFDLTADTAGSTMPGDTTYGFDCRIDDGDCTADGNFADCDFPITTSATAYTKADLCQYPVTAGTYTAKVAVQRGVGTAEDTVSIGPIVTNSIPEAAITCNPASCVAYDSEILTLQNTSSDPDGAENITQSTWDILGFGSDPELTCPPGPALCNYTIQLMPTGDYTMQLSVEDSQGDTDSAQKPFTLKRDIAVNFECSLNGLTWQACSTLQPSQGEVVQFRDASVPSEGASAITSWVWTFQDGNPASANTSTASTIFQSSGSKTVTLQVADNDGRARTGTKTINLAVPFPEWQEISPF